jgi:hypothetical protein
MQKCHTVPHALVLADQDTPEAIHPAARALHHPPPCLERGFRLHGFGLFPLRSHKSSKSELGEQSTDRLRVIALVQAPPLRYIWGGLRPLDGEALDGIPCHLEVMAVGALHGEADRHAAAVGKYTALSAGFATVGRGLAHRFPSKRGCAHRPVHGQLRPVNAVQCVVVGKAHRPPRQQDPSLGPCLTATWAERLEQRPVSCSTFPWRPVRST